MEKVHTAGEKIYRRLKYCIAIAGLLVSIFVTNIAYADTYGAGAYGSGIYSSSETPDTSEPDEEEDTPSIISGSAPTRVVSTQIQVQPQYTFTRNLELGNTGPDVIVLQNILIAKGLLAPGYATGYFGPLTRQALVNYQKINNISPAIGYFGPLTRASLQTTVVIVSLPTPVPAPINTSIFTRNLDVGDTGADVLALQKFLNAKGFTLALSGPGSPGNETTRFGGATQAALVKFQKAYGITPAIGYFGPITREKVKSLI
ncbi:MAG: peptidoglycan-binding protein [Patescibacteria group bacterium]